MNQQLDFFVPASGPPRQPAEVYRHAARQQFVLRQVLCFADRFHPDFHAWLQTNLAVWEHFEHEANRAWAAGRRHYSSRTLWEVMRHETQLREAEGEFKLNNNRAPDVARLYLIMYPDRPGFFETRGRE